MRTFVLILMWCIMVCALSADCKDMDSDSIPTYLENIVISKIIEDNKLESKLHEHPFFGLRIGKFWLVTLKNAYSYECYYGVGFGNNKISRHSAFALSTKEFNSIFKWNDRKLNIPRDIEREEHPHWFVLEFVLYNENHEIKLEFDASTEDTYKMSQPESIRNELPLTIEQMEFIVKMLLAVDKNETHRGEVLLND